MTGATGGCGSFAIDMLAGLGYAVAALTGKPAEHEYLKRIGASRVIDRAEIAAHPRALDAQRWAACIDAVGGAPLDFALRTMRKGGIVAAFGNAAGESFTTSIYPFILRSVTLAGVNANHPIEARTGAWGRMTRDLAPRHLDTIVRTLPFADLPAYCATVIEGGVRGRAVVRFQPGA